MAVSNKPKTDFIKLRIDKDKKDKFKELTEKNNTNMSEELLKHIELFISKYENKIDIQELEIRAKEVDNKINDFREKRLHENNESKNIISRIKKKLFGSSVKKQDL